MCINPISVRNPRKFFRPSLDKLYLTVPCGHCPECIQRRQDDWYVRLHYEYERYKRLNGSVFFVTLSYNDSSIPLLDLSKEEFDCLQPLMERSGYCWYDDSHEFHRYHFVHNGFNKEHLRKFFKNFRTLNEKFGYASEGIKYFCVCEYGGKFARPHYHVLLFVPYIMDAGRFKLLCERAWSDKVPFKDVPETVKRYYLSRKNDIWTWLRCSSGIKCENDWFIFRDNSGRKTPIFMHCKGFAMYSKKGAQIMQSKGMKYLLKYLEKDSAFMSIEPIREFSQFVSELPALSDLNAPEQKPLLNAVKRCKDFIPFHLQSYGIGLDLYHELNIQDDISAMSDTEINDKVQQVIDNKVSIVNETYQYSIPQYIINHLFYVYEKNPVTHEVEYRDITPFGAHVLKERFESEVSHLSRKYEKFVNIYPRFFTDYDKELFTRTFHLDFNTFINSLPEYLNSIYATSRDLAIYKMVFQNISIYAYKDLPLHEYSIADFTRFARNLFDNKVESHNIREGGTLRDVARSDLEILSDNLFNDLPQFKDFDFVLSAMDYIINRVKELSYRDSQFEEMKANELRNLISHYLYGI